MLDRRTFVGTGVCALAALPTQDARGEDAEISRAARSLYRRAIVVDGNMGAPLYDLPVPPEGLAEARASGLTVVKATIGGFGNDFAATIEELAAYDRACELHPEHFVQIRNVADIAAAKRAGRLGIIYSFEGVAMLEDKVERIGLFRNLGVRVMQLSYNLPSPFGAGVLSPPDSGLTELGRAAVAAMNEEGVAIDLSHANPATTDGAIAASQKPVLMTHGGCAAVHEHPRNKTDAQLRALAEKGGVFGIYDLPYLTPSPRQPTLDDYMAHMQHALDVCGEDHVGIGSDTSFGAFDTSSEAIAEFQKLTAERQARGVAAPGEDRMPYVVGLNAPDRCARIADALLKRRKPARVVEKILGGNFMRAFSEIW